MSSTKFHGDDQPTQVGRSHAQDFTPVWRSQLSGVLSLWRLGAEEPGWLRGRTLRWIGYAVVVTSAVFRFFSIELGYFWQQDYGWMSRAAQSELTPRFLFDGIAGQPSVVGAFVTWVFVRVAPYDFALAGVVIALLWTVALFSLWRVLRLIWPDEPTTLLPLAVTAWGLVTLPTSLWFTVAAWALPALIAAVWLGQRLLTVRDDQPAIEFGAAFVYLVGLLCTPLFELTLIGLLLLLVARTSELPLVAAFRCEIQRRTPFWLITLAVTIGYLLMLRANGGQWHALGISADALLSSFGSVAGWPSMAVRLAVIALAVWLTVRTGGPRAVRSWGALAVVAVGCVAVTWLVAGVTADAVRNPLTYAPVLGLGALAAAMALAPPGAEGPPSGHDPGRRRLADSARAQLVVLALVNIVVLTGWLGSTGFLGYWRANESRIWMINAVDSLRQHPAGVKLLDREVPRSILGADAGIPALNSRLFAPEGLGAAFATTATDNGVLSEGGANDPFAAGPWQGFNPTAGRLVPGRLDGSSFDNQKCTPITEGGVTVTLNGAVPPGDNDIEVQTNAPSAGAVTLTLSGGEPVELPVESGRSTVFSRAYGGGTDVRLSTNTPGLCVRRVAVGRLVAAG